MPILHTNSKPKIVKRGTAIYNSGFLIVNKSQQQILNSVQAIQDRQDKSGHPTEDKGIENRHW